MDEELFDEKYDTVVVVIKPEPIQTVSTFKDPETMDIPVLADPGSSVHEAYGLIKPYHFHRQNMYLPATMLIDKEGTLRWLHIGKKNSDRPNRELIVQHLAELTAE
ncbi:MAG: redoxin domain-containing protein [Candidatus Poribacteria bacterium]|nr:redoxin domain-containing protein [Candidatus Poribacteria bacterium]